MTFASPPPSMPRCSPLSRSFLSGQSLRSGVTWQLSRSEDRHDQPDQSVHALSGTPPGSVITNDVSGSRTVTVDDGSWLSSRFEASRPHMLAVAYRMLGPRFVSVAGRPA